MRILTSKRSLWVLWIRGLFFNACCHRSSYSQLYHWISALNILKSSFLVKSRPGVTVSLLKTKKVLFMCVFCGSTVNLSEYQLHQNISRPVSSSYGYSYQWSLTHDPIFSYRKQSKANQLVELISFYMRGKLIVNWLTRLIKNSKNIITWLLTVTSTNCSYQLCIQRIFICAQPKLWTIIWTYCKLIKTIGGWMQITKNSCTEL